MGQYGVVSKVQSTSSSEVRFYACKQISKMLIESKGCEEDL